MKRVITWTFGESRSHADLWEACGWLSAPDLLIAPFAYQREFYRSGTKECGVTVPRLPLDLAVARLGGPRPPARPSFGLLLRTAEAAIAKMPPGPLDRVRETAGFVRSFLGWMREAERHRKDPARLLASSEEAVRWLAAAAEETERLLRQMDWKDRRSWVSEVRDQGVTSKNRRIFVDGFLEFSPEELILLSAIAQENDTVICLPSAEEGDGIWTDSLRALLREEGWTIQTPNIAIFEESDEKAPHWQAATGPVPAIRLALAEAVRRAEQYGWEAADIVVGDPALLPILRREAEYAEVPVSFAERTAVAHTAVGREIWEILQLHAAPFTEESLARRVACKIFPLPSMEELPGEDTESDSKKFERAREEMAEEKEAFLTFRSERLTSLFSPGKAQKRLLSLGATAREVRLGGLVLQRLPLFLEEAMKWEKSMSFTEEQALRYWEDRLSEPSLLVPANLTGLRVSAFSESLGLPVVSHRILVGFGPSVPVVEEANFLLRAPYFTTSSNERRIESTARAEFSREAVRFSAMVAGAQAVTVVLDAPAAGEHSMQSPLLGHRFGTIPTKYEKELRTAVVPLSFALTEEQVRVIENSEKPAILRSQTPSETLYRGLPARYSSSALESYVACPFQYWVKYILGGFETEDPNLRRERGVMQHVVLARYLEENKESIEKALQNGEVPEPDATSLAGIVEEEGRRADLPPIVRERIRRLLVPFLRLDLERMATHPAFRSFATEEVFELRITKGSRCVELFGRVDRIEENSEGERLLLDFKSGVNAADKRSIREGRSLQMPIYSMANSEAFVAYGMIRGLAFSARHVPDEWLAYDTKFNFDSKEWESLLAQTETLIFETDENIRSGRFPIQPSEEICQFCAFSAVCRKAEGSVV